MYSDDVLVTNGTSLLPHRYSTNTKNRRNGHVYRSWRFVAADPHPVAPRRHLRARHKESSFPIEPAGRSRSAGPFFCESEAKPEFGPQRFLAAVRSARPAPD